MFNFKLEVQCHTIIQNSHILTYPFVSPVVLSLCFPNFIRIARLFFLYPRPQQITSRPFNKNLIQLANLTLNALFQQSNKFNNLSSKYWQEFSNPKHRVNCHTSIQHSNIFTFLLVSFTVHVSFYQLHLCCQPFFPITISMGNLLNKNFIQL